ncbi:MAG: GDP-mannose 4,6-dehydratase [Anaerolineae bacterium]|nr:GDP-mannose 4,6-dehydratase [Anaerolineae bacterium]
MSYLITGGAGFVGSHVAQKLLARGERVVVLDNFNDYYDPALKHANIARIQHANLVVVNGDIRDTDLVPRLFREQGITHVAHLAAMANVRSSINQTPLYVQINVNGSVNLLEAARDVQVQQFVMASTGSVYGATPIIPFVETDTADRPLASYPATKRAAELLAHTYHNLNHMHITILRFFNVYGPAGRPDMMPLRLMNAAVDGTVIPLFNDGQIHRDWTYIDDTVDGVIAALDRPLGYEIINLGCGSPVLLRDFVDIIEELSGRSIPTRAEKTPPSDPPITFCDNSKARRLLGFDPQVKVQQGLAHTWDWFRAYKGL